MSSQQLTDETLEALGFNKKSQRDIKSICAKCASVQAVVLQLENGEKVTVSNFGKVTREDENVRC